MFHPWPRHSWSFEIRVHRWFHTPWPNLPAEETAQPVAAVEVRTFQELCGEQANTRGKLTVSKRVSAELGVQPGIPRACSPDGLPVDGPFFLMNTQHLILTRYNVGLYRPAPSGVAYRRADKSAWMSQRLHLFRTWCYPSVLRQSLRDWKWLIALDAQTSQEDLAAIQSVINDERVHLTWAVPGAAHPAWPALIAPHVHDSTTTLITSRLDNDDMLHELALETVQRYVDPTRDRHFVDFPVGIFVQGDGKLIRQIDRSHSFPRGGTAFLSLVEKRDASGFLAAFCCAHTRAARIAPVTAGTPM